MVSLPAGPLRMATEAPRDPPYVRGPGPATRRIEASRTRRLSIS